MTRTSVILSSTTLVFALACGGNAPSGPLPVGQLPALADTPEYAVVLSDYTSSAIAMVRFDGTAIDDRWLSSGTTTPGLVAAISGDVVLPRVSPGDGSMWVIDRFRTDVITRISVPDGAIFGQVRAQDPEATSGGWSSNPHDVVRISPTLAWVSRFETNLDPMAPELERGNDLYAIDPTNLTQLGMRIDMSRFDVMVPNRDGMMVTASARPSSIVRLGDRLVVGLSRLSGAFDGAGEGAVAVVTMGTNEVQLVELPGLRDCSRVVPAGARAIVACTGFGTPFGDEASTRATSGIAVLEMSATGASVTSTLRFGEHPDLPIASTGVTYVEGDRVLAIAWGSFDTGSPDRLYEVDLAASTVAELAASSGPFELGTMAYDGPTRMLFVPDATMGLRRLEHAPAGSWLEIGPVVLAADLGLPARHVFAL